MTTTGRDQSLAARVVVRVLDEAGDAVGAGFLVGPDRVATCAHVVASALRADPYAATPPAARVRLDFPLLPDTGGSVEAEITRWVPIEPDGSGDVAVLRLSGAAPDGARMPPLRRVDQLWDRPFRVLGFPEGMTDGVWSTGRFRGVQGTSWFQLQCDSGEQPIVGGFSGSPVWDEESDAVVGMTVAADSSGTTRTAFLIPIDRVLGLDPELLPCPYRGLDPFDEEHAAYFFGRDADIDQLADLAAAQPLVAVAGPSGVGKSSLVRAGLLPRLRAAGTEVTDVALVPGGSVTEALVAALRPFVPPESAPSDEVLELAAAVTAPLMLVIDQFEELAAADPEAAQELLELIGDLVRPGTAVRAVLTLRWATLDDVVVPELATLLRKGTFLLPPMSRAQLREAIVAPAERAPGLSFEAGLVERILDDAAGEPGGLPLVESLLTELWERREGGYLTLTAYEQAGGVGGVVATHADKVVAGFTDLDDEVRLKRIFTTLAAADREGRFTRRRRRWDELAPELRPLVQRLAAGRLLVVEPATTGERTVQLAHQALIDHWPRLHDWLTDDRDFLAWRDQLDGQRERWESAKRDEGALLRGTALAASQDWLPARAADVSQPSRDYVHRSRARQRREVRRWRMVTAVLAVLVLAAGALAAVAVARGNEVNDQLRLANAEIIAQAALARAYSDPVTATQLALAAWRLDPGNAAARSALLRQYAAMRSVEAVFPAVAAESVPDFGSSADGQVVGVREGASVVVLSGVMGGTAERRNVPDVPPDSAGAELSSDGRYLAVPRNDGVVLVWDIAARSGPRAMNSADRPARSGTVRFTTDGHLTWVVVHGPNETELVMIDPGSGSEVPHGLGVFHQPTLPGVYVTQDPTIAVVASGRVDDGTSHVVARSLVDGSTVREFPRASVTVENGALVLSCAEPATPPVAVVQRSETGAELARIGMLGEACSLERLLNATADGGYFVEPRSTTRDKNYDMLRLTRLTDGRSYDLTLPPDLNLDPDFRFTDPMSVIESADGPPTVLMSRGSALLRLRADVPPGGIGTADVELSKDGRYFVATVDDSVTVFDRQSGSELATLPGNEIIDRGNSVNSVNEGVGVMTRVDTETFFTHYTLPKLEMTNRILIPRLEGPTPSTLVAVSYGEERIVTLTGGVLSAFDAATDELLGEPVVLVKSSRDEAFYRDNANFRTRPGHPGEVALVTSDEVELWNLAQQPPQHRTLPQRQGSETYDVVFDASGQRLAGLSVDNTAEVWDVDTGTPVHPPFPIPASALPVGFDADGNLVLRMGSAAENVRQLTFWDVATGRQNGSSIISTTHGATNEVTDDGLSLPIVGYGGAVPFVLPLTAQQWFDRLCLMSDRPFTDAERDLLPAGASSDPPCD